MSFLYTFQLNILIAAVLSALLCFYTFGQALAQDNIAGDESFVDFTAESNAAPQPVPDLLQEAQQEGMEIILPVPEVVEDNQVPVPGVQDLTSPGEAQEPLNYVSDIPSLPVEEDVDENLFFDAEALVPTGEMGLKGGPRKVSPRLEPASKFIVVRKNYSSKSSQAQLVSAERAMSLGRYQAALDMYEALYAKNKRDPNILIGRATAYQHVGNAEAAIQAYEELLELRPNNVEAQINMLGLMGQRYPAVALRRLMDLREENPGHVGVAAQIAVVQAELGRYEDAIKYLGIAAGMEPRNAGHIFNMAVIADRAGSTDQAVRYYEEALEIDTIYGGGRTIPRDSVFERLAQLR